MIKNNEVDRLLKLERKRTTSLQILAFICLVSTVISILGAIWGNTGLFTKIGLSSFVAFYIIMKISKSVTVHYFERAAIELEKMNGMRNPNIKQTNPLNN